MPHLHFLLALTLTSLSPSTSTPSTPILLPPYVTCRNFLDQPVVLTEEMMNDDFCDCYDSGFDEFTTTSACSHLDNAPLLQASTTGTGTSVASIRTCRVPQSRYFDGICDCCDGSDERPGLCHDTCADTYQQTITSAIAVLQMTTRGHKQYRNAMKDATKQMKTMHDKVEALAKSRQELRQLEVTLQIYMNDERNSEPTKGGWPRYDYAMLAKQFMMKELQEAKRAGLRAAPPRKDDIVLHPILDVKCPSSDFTLDNFFRVMTAPTNDPRKVGWYGMPPGADKNLLLDKMLENPTLLALRIVGTILFTPVQIPLFGANSVMARVLGWEEGAEEVAEVKLAQTATPLEVEIEAPDPYSLNTILLKLTIIHPALDYRLYPVTRRSVQGIRRLYRQITEPLGVMWESPMVVLNNTIAWGGGAMIKDPDSHEFRLLKAAAEKLKRSMRDVGNKLEAAGDELRKDYGPLITVNGNSYSSDIEKYVYRISPLKDVRQDTTKLGFFESWRSDYSGYSIGSGQACHGLVTIDERGVSSQKRRGGFVELKCGGDHKITKVMENEPCVYEIEFTTFLACKKEDVEEKVGKVREAVEMAGGGGVRAGDVVDSIRAAEDLIKS